MKLEIAISTALKANGLRVSGSLDPATVEALGLTGGGGGYASPKSAPANSEAK